MDNNKNEKDIKINIDKVFVESGCDLNCCEFLRIRQPYIKDILQLGNGINCERAYWSLIHSILCDPYDNMVELDNLGINYQKVTPFDVFVLKWQNGIKNYEENKELYDKYGIHPLNIVRQALSFFLVNPHDDNYIFDFVLSKYEDDEPVLIDKNNSSSIQINRDIFNIMSAFIEMMNNIGKQEHIKPANEMARKILLEDMREEQERRKNNLKLGEEENIDYLGRMIRVAIYGGNSGITPFNFKELKIGQLFLANKCISKKINFDNVISGVYFGTVKQEDLSGESLNWAG